ncbi:MAG TPA: hypothetical protein VHI78_04580 [Bacteroidales bacterium]|jgi:hypothetical protein|nr:hypothetical protein [Bacteroidales bacterium]
MMKRLFISVLCVLLAGIAKNQTVQPAEVPHDTIFKINGQQMPVDVTTVTPTYISFVFPGKPEEFTIERKEVHKIIYKTGKIDILNQAAFVMFDESSWEAVWITEDKKEVGDLYMLGEVEAKSPSSARSPAAAKKGAIIKLKKKAANLKGTLILVTKKQATGGYGEYPGYYIKGIAYGPEPPSEGLTPAQQGASVKDAGM